MHYLRGRKSVANSSAVLVVFNLESLREQSIKESLLGPQSYTPNQHSNPREYQFRPHLGDRFNNGHQHVMRSWHQDQIQAAKIDPVLYIQPHTKYLAEYLSSKILKASTSSLQSRLVKTRERGNPSRVSS